MEGILASCESSVGLTTQVWVPDTCEGPGMGKREDFWAVQRSLQSPTLRSSNCLSGKGFQKSGHQVQSVALHMPDNGQEAAVNQGHEERKHPA